MFHRLGRFYRPEESSLNQAHDDSIPSEEQVIEQSVLDRIGLSFGRKSSKGRKRKMIRKIVVATVLGILKS